MLIAIRLYNAVLRRSSATPLQSQGRFLWIKLSISYNFQLSIEEVFNFQFSIFNFWGLVLVSVKRRNEVERPERRCLSRRRVCGAHSETKWRSSSADAALSSLVLSGSSQKERITITKQKKKKQYETTINHCHPAVPIRNNPVILRLLDSATRRNWSIGISCLWRDIHLCRRFIRGGL